MRLLVLAVLLSGCATTRGLSDVKPLPPERHEETAVTAYFYPANEGGPTKDRLYVCGLANGKFSCIRWDDYMKYLDETSPEGVSL